jgi:hypothetical protein
MRKFGIHTLAQSIETERFSSQNGDSEVAGPPGRRGAETAMSPVSPAPVRLRRANPTSCETQAQPAMPLAVAFGIDVPSEEPSAGLTSEPTQVRYWRTPNRLMNQVWARKPDSTMPLTAATDDLHEGEVPLQGEILQGEVDIAPMRSEEDIAAALDVIPAAPTPFVFISDHALKACSRISACAARSSMSAPARSSRSTNSSRRPASNPRASSAWPTISPAR